MNLNLDDNHSAICTNLEMSEIKFLYMICESLGQKTYLYHLTPGLTTQV